MRLPGGHRGSAARPGPSAGRAPARQEAVKETLKHGFRYDPT